MTITNINVHVLQESVSLKAFNFLAALLQSKNSITFNRSVNIIIDYKLLKKENNSTISILFSNMPQGIDVDLTHYDLIIFSNSDEPLLVATDQIVKNISEPNCFLISNSFLTQDHRLFDSVIFSSHDLLICHQYWTNPVYPQYYSNSVLSTTERTKGILFINGENRANRHHFLTLLKTHAPEITIRSTISSNLIIHELNDAHWETEEDYNFRSTVNELYNISRMKKTTYYDDSIIVGINSMLTLEGLENKVSTIPPGYFILPEYYEYQCVIFPESGWQNNELSITEKSLKCFYSGAIPWPIGGSNINKLYNKLGFKTAWNLLPDCLKEYDSEIDHFKRYEKIITAIKWMQTNLHVLSSTEAENIRKENKQQFLDNNISQITAEQLWNAIKTSM